jgi:hypothetical protein
MRVSRSLATLVVFAIFFTSAVSSGCTSKQVSADQPVDAINTIRAKLKLPDLPLEFIEMTHMTNSPNGDLEVALYQDPDGRKYFVDLPTNQVVEIDARSILTNIPSNAVPMSDEDIKALALKLVSATISDFVNLQSSWTYEEGNKGDNFFFSWYADIPVGSINRPFIQIGLHRSGVLFAYYNTMSIDQ